MSGRTRLLLAAYDLLWFLALPLVLLYLLTRRDSRRRLGQYLGRPSASARRTAARSARGTLLVHAVSVGEVLSVVPVVRLLRERLDLPVILSTTIDDAETISTRAPGVFDATTFAPLDASPFVDAWLDRLSPRLVLVSETDLWPTMIRRLSERGVPAYLTNGRISDGIARGLRLMGRPSAEILSGFRRFFVQTPRDGTALTDAGVPGALVEVAGNTKYEGAATVGSPSPATERRMAAIRHSGRSVVVAGSTHPGEEELILDTVVAMPEAERPLVVLAPRIIGRTPDILDLARRRDLSTRTWTEFDAASTEFDADVLVIDALGELKHLYGAADVVFVGGTFAPVGGHNFLEAAAQGRPILVGPDTRNFHRDVQLFLDGDGLVVTPTRESFAATLARLLADPDEARALGERGARVLGEQQGAARRIARTILGLEEEAA